MMIGAVDEDGNAVVSIVIAGHNSVKMEIDCIVDTGFNEGLTLPPDLVEALQLPYDSTGTFTLADGSQGFASVFNAVAEWLGGSRHVLVLALDGAPLIGMALLRGSRLTIDVVPAGRVAIESLD